MKMKKILLVLLVLLVIGCAGVVSAADNNDGAQSSSGDSSQGNDNKTDDKQGSASAKPVASFTPSITSGNAPLTVTFTSNSTNYTTISWDFGDNNSSSLNTSSVTHTYTKAGKYTVNLTAKNSANDVSSQTHTITVSEVVKAIPTISKVESNISVGLSPLAVKFTATANNNPTSYNWEFGDTTLITSKDNGTVEHTYTQVGTHTVNVTATNLNGTSAVQQMIIVVNANTSAYKLSIDATPLNGTAPLQVTFKLNTTIPESVITKYTWDFGYSKKKGDATEVSTQRDPPAQTYEEDGTYKVTLEIRTKNSELQTASIEIIVSDLVPSFTASTTSGVAPLEVKFTDTSKGPTSWLWTIYKMNNQNTRTSVDTRTAQNITYTFNSEGTYEVELNATKNSKSVTTYKTITVNTKATTAATTAATTKRTTAATTAATPTPAVKTMMDDGPVPNPIDVIDEFLRLLLAMLNPAKYSITI